MEKEKLEQVIAKAWSDPAFKQKLVNSPKEALLECGISLQEGVNFHVVENTTSDVYFVLPNQPQGEMSESELRKAAGGALNVTNALGAALGTDF